MEKTTIRAVAMLENSGASIQDGSWHSQHRTGWNHKFDEGAGLGIRESQLSTKFFGALLHASDAHSNAVRLQLGNSPADSLAIIAHGNYDHIFFLAQCNPHLSRF